MANTSFSGPVRSKGNFKLFTETASTGLDSDRTLGTTAKDARRVYLDEWFLQRPGLNANIDQVSTVEVQRALNRNWEALGTNMTTALCTFAGTSGGVKATTAGADQDQAIITPHLDTAATAWAGCLWGTENEATIVTGKDIQMGYRPHIDQAGNVFTKLPPRSRPVGARKKDAMQELINIYKRSK